ncbi:hypothetical protein [Streptomyces sp. NPDC001978]|uniref:hypothetical protein n=1 Tax=Streptomyces sp. NPDC001978 TaxID=3364627 RepID=UPI0036A2B62F
MGRERIALPLVCGTLLMTIQGVRMALAGAAAEVVGVRSAVVVCCCAPAFEALVTESRDGADRHMTGR